MISSLNSLEKLHRQYRTRLVLTGICSSRMQTSQMISQRSIQTNFSELEKHPMRSLMEHPYSKNPTSKNSKRMNKCYNRCYSSSTTLSHSSRTICSSRSSKLIGTSLNNKKLLYSKLSSSVALNWKTWMKKSTRGFSKHF